MSDRAAIDAYAGHIADVRACTRCDTVVGPPVVGPAPGARILWIGQAPGPREGRFGRPFAWTAGRAMFRWFEPHGVDETTFRARVHMCAVVRCFPGSHPTGGDRVPSRREIHSCFPYLEREIELLRPELIVPVGRLAIDRFLTARTLGEIVGRRFDGDVTIRRQGADRRRDAGGDREMLAYPATVIPLPHPSGRSTWLVHVENRRLLERAIALIVAHPAWQATFAERLPAAARS